MEKEFQLGFGGEFDASKLPSIADLSEDKLEPIISTSVPKEQLPFVEEIPNLWIIREKTKDGYPTREGYTTRTFLQDAILQRRSGKRRGRFLYVARVPVDLLIETPHKKIPFTIKAGQIVYYPKGVRKIPKKLVPDVTERLRDFAKLV